MILERLSEAICSSSVLVHAFGDRDNAPHGLLARLSADPTRETLTKTELADIAAVKLAAQPGETIARARVKENADQDVELAARAAFAATNARQAVEPLCALKGVGVPVASAALSWCFPHKWPVIDAHAWRTLETWKLVQPRARETTFLAHEYVPFCATVAELSLRTNLTPQQIDRWLYAASKCQLRPEHFQ